jgi:hypothetical protein
MFFKNREVRIKLSKTNDPDDHEYTSMDDVITPDNAKLLEETGKKLAMYSALAVTSVIVVFKVADTLSQIAVKKTKSADNN